MDLEFTQQEDLFVADFAAESDFNLHIEQAEKGFVDMYQSGVQDGRYDLVKSLSHYHGSVLDCDCTALLYPKYIRIVLRAMPTKAVVTFA